MCSILKQNWKEECRPTCKCWSEGTHTISVAMIARLPVFDHCLIFKRPHHLVLGCLSAILAQKYDIDSYISQHYSHNIQNKTSKHKLGDSLRSSQALLMQALSYAALQCAVGSLHQGGKGVAEQLLHTVGGQAPDGPKRKEFPHSSCLQCKAV